MFTIGDVIFDDEDETNMLAEWMVDSHWQPWYAWRPVRINNKWHWLTTVYRRKVYFIEGEGVDRFPPWTYGDVFDLLKE